jgi:hypothetical protein
MLGTTLDKDYVVAFRAPLCRDLCQAVGAEAFGGCGVPGISHFIYLSQPSGINTIVSRNDATLKPEQLFV